MAESTSRPIVFGSLYLAWNYYSLAGHSEYTRNHKTATDRNYFLDMNYCLDMNFMVNVYTECQT